MRGRIFILVGLMLCFLSMGAKAVTWTEGDQKVLREFQAYAREKGLIKLPVNERVTWIGKFFLGKPYKSGTLNVTAKELPVINLRELDCVTLVENTLALAFLDDYTGNIEEPFVRNIMKLRYRNAEIQDYTSRLHYSSDWLYEMQRQHLLSDMTRAEGGKKLPLDICFMTKNYTKYPVLEKDTSLLSKMKVIETAINKRTYYYIPKAEISGISGNLEDGDIILITTNIKGLDTSHLGFALKKGGKVYLLHASSTGKKVVITDVPLEKYMEGISSQTGIIVGRAGLIEPELLMPD